MNTAVETTLPKRATAISLNRLAYRISRNWIILFNLIYGPFVALPFLAPVFMAAGWTALGRLIYFIYSFLCHQLPERSLFLFGPKIMVPLADILANYQATNNILILRQFIGNPAMGWKVAWSDRMVYMFTSILIFAWIWWLFRRQSQRFTWKFLVVFLLPLALDGTTHLISDLSGLHNGFRDSNAWLAVLTQNTFPATFYAGDAWGSYNSILRLISGLMFGFGIVWFAFPYLNDYFQEQAAWIQYKLACARIKL